MTIDYRDTTVDQAGAKLPVATINVPILNFEASGEEVEEWRKIFSLTEKFGVKQVRELLESVEACRLVLEQQPVTIPLPALSKEEYERVKDAVNMYQSGNIPCELFGEWVMHRQPIDTEKAIPVYPPKPQALHAFDGRTMRLLRFDELNTDAVMTDRGPAVYLDEKAPTQDKWVLEPNPILSKEFAKIAGQIMKDCEDEAPNPHVVGGEG